HFPAVQNLAAATLDEVLQHWQGLGYYSRARNLHKTAQVVCTQYGGNFPEERKALEALPGIGRSTAAAILSLSRGQAHAILDGNVKRVLARYHAVDGWVDEPRTLQKLWAYAEQHLPQQRNAAYTQAMMDLGATLCTRGKPRCLLCPLHSDCLAFQQGNPQAYPSKRPSETLPEKTTLALLLRNPNGELLLEKRPPNGVWGGLWSFPEFVDYRALQTWLEQHGQDTSTMKVLPTLT
ncbi:MAG: A/G-specific adenine glycosylase, partial [Thiothrix sp.]